MEYLIHLAIFFCIYAILALSLDLVMGYAGLLSLAHAAFFGIGAYTVAILSAVHGYNFFIASLAGAILAMLLGALVGFVLSKFKGDYYTFGSLGFNFIVFAAMLNL